MYVFQRKVDESKNHDEEIDWFVIWKEARAKYSLCFEQSNPFCSDFFFL